MSLKIKTEILKDLMNKAVKGAGLEKGLPITNMLEIECKDDTLSLHTTDRVNHLFVTSKLDECENLKAVIDDVTQFSKLVSKLNCEYVTLSLTGEVLVVKGNGTYKFPLVFNQENGTVLEFPNPLTGFEPDYGFGINANQIRAMLNVVRPSLSTDIVTPQYTGYYVGKSVIGTDSYKMANINMQLCEDSEMLIPARVVDILGINTGETVNVNVRKGNNRDEIEFTGDGFKLYAVTLDCINDFAIEPISNLVNNDFPYSCKINRNEMIQALDRLALFVGPYDKDTVNFNFVEDGIEISSMSDNGVEHIKYTEPTESVIYNSPININQLLTELKAVDSEIITLQHGNDIAVKFITTSDVGAVTLVVALTED